VRSESFVNKNIQEKAICYESVFKQALIKVLSHRFFV